MSDKHQDLIDKLASIVLTGNTEDWSENEPYRDLTNINAGLMIDIEPRTALHLNEVKKFTIKEDVSGTITTTFVRKK